MNIVDAPRYQGKLMSSVGGGYPVIYYTADNAELCHTCAQLFIDEPEIWNPEECTVTQFDVFYEGAPIMCEHCYVSIASAYGDPEDDDTEVGN